MQFVPEEEIHSFFHHITEKNNPWTSIKCSGDIQRFLHSVLADMESLPPLRFSHEDIFSMLLGGFRFNDIFGGAHFSSKEEFMEFLRQDAVLHKQSIKE